MPTEPSAFSTSSTSTSPALWSRYPGRSAMRKSSRGDTPFCSVPAVRTMSRLLRSLQSPPSKIQRSPATTPPPPGESAGTRPAGTECRPSGGEPGVTWNSSVHLRWQDPGRLSRCKIQRNAAIRIRGNGTGRSPVIFEVSHLVIDHRIERSARSSETPRDLSHVAPSSAPATLSKRLARTLHSATGTHTGKKPRFAQRGFQHVYTFDQLLYRTTLTTTTTRPSALVRRY